VLALRVDEGEGIALGELSRERIDDVRRQLPALEHRRRFSASAGP
jgi:predicted amidohydrolase